MEIRLSVSVADDVRLVPVREGAMRKVVFPVRVSTWYDLPEEGLVQLTTSFALSLGEPNKSSLLETEDGGAAESFVGPDIVHLPSISFGSALAAFTRLQVSISIKRARGLENALSPLVELGVPDRDPFSVHCFKNNSGIVRPESEAFVPTFPDVFSA